MKMTRKQIREGLEQVPIEALLVGATNASEIKLTAKEKAFAKELAAGATKSDAYRKAYKPKGSRATVNKRAYEVSKREAVMGYAERIEAAMEAERLRTPAHLRALVIKELTDKALDPEINPSQQIKALELLGKITEVALFTERREIVRVDNADKAKAALLDSIHAAMKARSTDVEYRDALSLIDEIRGGANETIEAETPPGGHPPDSEIVGEEGTHSNPHIQSPSLADQPSPNDIDDSEVKDA